jgi:hypothetical protein
MLTVREYTKIKSELEDTLILHKKDTKKRKKNNERNFVAIILGNFKSIILLRGLLLQGLGYVFSGMKIVRVSFLNDGINLENLFIENFNNTDIGDESVLACFYETNRHLSTLKIRALDTRPRKLKSITDDNARK